MQRLQLRLSPKGAVHAPERRAVLGWLRSRACSAYTTREIERAMAVQGLLAPGRGQKWLSGCLSYLLLKGHVTNVKACGVTRWQAASPHPDLPPEGEGEIAPAANPPSVAAPRRINVFAAPPLSGNDHAPTREGAMDYAACPSIINGQRVPYRINSKNFL